MVTTNMHMQALLGERSEPRTGLFNRDFALYINVDMSVESQNA